MKKSILLCNLAILLIFTGCNQSACKTYSPVIGITSVYQINDQNDLSASTSVDFSYIQAVLDNGGTPVILPTIKDECAINRYVRWLDGLVLVGGYDIPPAAYGQLPHETVKPILPERYDFEISLIPLWLKSGKPILGICLGMQFTNVLSGGTLIQDIPSQAPSNIDHRSRNYHPVNIEPNSRLAKILKTQKVNVYSSHHQAVDKLGKNLKIVARSPDGIIEALERTKGGFGLFVQWHPELMEEKSHRDAIYGALVKSARRWMDDEVSYWHSYHLRGPLFMLGTLDY